MKKEDILNDAAYAIVKCNKVEAVEVMNRGIAAGIDPAEMFMDGFGLGLHEVGEQFGKGRLFVSELMLAAEAMKAVFSIVNAMTETPNITQRNLGTILIATVEGDIHDIGKSFVVSVMRAHGLHVVDLGCDVSVEMIIRKAIEYDAAIIGTSALLTTTKPQQEKLEMELRKRGLRQRLKPWMGGAPATQSWADRIGADAYAVDGKAAAQCALLLLLGQTTRRSE